jgi:outer membrane protein assembly factor BamD
MKMTLRFVLPLTIALFAFPVRSPAPIIYREGEGFLSGAMEDIEIKKNAQEQFDLGQRYEQQGDYKHAGASYRLVVRRFPRADIAAEAQYNSGRMYEKVGDLQRAFYEYQGLVEKYPRSPQFEPALDAEYGIAKAYLDGKRVSVYGVPTLPSMTKAQEMFRKIVVNAPYSRIAPLAQYGIGQALEKSGAIKAAVNAYQQVVDRYPNSSVAADAQYQIGYVYLQASRETGYDQTAAVRSQESFEDFLLKYPNSEKVPQAQDNLKTLQGRKTVDAYNIARFYDGQKNYKAAYVYYNEVVQQQPNSSEADQAKRRMDQLRSKLGEDALKIGTEKPLTGPAAGERRKLQAQVDTASRPDFVGPPAPTPSPSPQPTQQKKQMLTPPSDVTPQEPAPSGQPPQQPAPPSQPPPEPALPSQ